MSTIEALKQFSLPNPVNLARDLVAWVIAKGPWYAISFCVHLLIFVALGFVASVVPKVQGDAPLFELEPLDNIPDTELTHFDVGDAPLDPTVLDTESLLAVEAPVIEQSALNYDDNPEFIEAGGGRAASSDAPQLGGLGGFDVLAFGSGPAVKGPGGVGTGVGEEGGFGSGGSGEGFGGRGQGSRKAQVGSGGGTRQTERAVAAALNWFARHQNQDGSWSLNQFHNRCTDATCTGRGSEVSNCAATAFALLPFLAAGQSHKSKGPYRKVIYDGLSWLMKNQKANGDLSAGAAQVMYSHGLASIVMCEAYGLTKDKVVGESAQGAVNFIQAGQDPQTGGWWYQWKQRGGDTSVFGWQLMALKSAHMAGLKVNPSTFEGGRVWLKSVAKGEKGGLFCYTAASGPSNTMTSVGLLCAQYLGAERDDPAMVEGRQFLMANLPNNQARNCYYWYYATQVMHNFYGSEWDVWNRQMRRAFIETQCKEGCSAGSWDPEKPTKDAWADQGGRLMVTSIATLSLEVYYRYLPLYKMERPGEKTKDKTE